jgi:GNAT superfamily N-acetyltransferase
VELSDLHARRAARADADGVATTLALAFAGDPVWGAWAFGDIADPAARVCPSIEFWGPFVTAAIKHAGAWMTPAFEAVALWVPPATPEMDADDEAAAAAVIERVCGSRAALVLEGFDRFVETRPAADHWYLSLLATHPDHRGNGLGMALVADRLRSIDDEGLPSYLESTNPANLPRYSARGFEQIGGFDLPEGPRVDTMWRMPRDTS